MNDEKNKLIDSKLINRLDKRVKDKQSQMGSCMSDTKWKKLFEAINSVDVEIVSSKNISMYQDDEPENLFNISLKICGDKFTADEDGACPERLRDIEFIIITVRSVDDMMKLKNAIDSVGCLFEYEIVDQISIKIYGYK